jgi:ParB-like chromosome segregation protein Spo0J
MDDATKKLMEEIKSVKTQFWKIDKLIPYARNPRKNDHVVKRMADQIKEFGMPIPICIRPDGTIVDGHLRFKAARVLGLPEVPVVVNDTWTPEKIKAFRISVNKSAEWAEWDMQFLGLEMKELDDMGFALEKTGFDGKEIDQIMGSIVFAEGSNEGGDDMSFEEEGKSQIKKIQLFYDEETEQNFRRFIAFIEAKFASGNISDTVYSALQYCAEKLEKDKISF